MGIMNHNAVIATTWTDDEYERVLNWVVNLLPVTSRNLFAFGGSVANGYRTIFLAPDGSKEGWEESDFGNDLREQFINEIRKADEGDGSNVWDWIEVSFGEYGQKVLQGNCEKLAELQKKEMKG